MYRKKKFIASLLLFDLAIFLLAICFLPRRSGFTWRTGNPFSYLLRSRYDWHIVWFILGASLLISYAIYLLVDSFSKHGTSEENDDED